MVTLTIFTPTYNRKDLLKRGYEALKRQSCKDFKWMVVDDGSVDDTESVVNEWMKEDNGFEIIYLYKENGGLYTTYNHAIEHADTELLCCIDSDDYMPDDAVEKILACWKERGSDKVAGIVGLDYYFNDQVIGDPLPDQETVNLIDLLVGKYPIVNGDRTNVIRTEVYKKYAPLIGFEGEKNLNPHYMHLEMSKEYDFIVLNENLRYVEYQEEGMTSNIYKQYYNSPRSFLKTRELYLTFKDAPFKFKMKNSIHYVSSCLLCKEYNKLLKNPLGLAYSLVALIPGVVLNRVIKSKAGI